MRNFKKYTLTLRDGRSWVIDRPLIMGILNVTPECARLSPREPT